MSHHRHASRRRLLAASAAAAGLVVASLARHAAAQLVYEPFANTASQPLDSRINPGNAMAWDAMSVDPDAEDDILVVNPGGGGLSYGGLTPPLGNAVSWDASGASQRLALGPVVSSGALYYSAVLRVSALGTLTSSPTDIGGFSNRSGPSDVQPQTVGTRLFLRQSPNSTPQTPLFNIGVSKNSTNPNDIVFGDGVNGILDYAPGTPILVVGSYQINGTTQGTDDVARLYVNPSAADLGAAVAPGGSSPGSPVLTAPQAGTDLFDTGSPSLAGFVLRQGLRVPFVELDELRVDRTWAQVTPPAGVTWSLGGSGAWSQSGNWSTSVAPNDASAFVNFPAGGAARTVTVDTPIDLRTINLVGSQPYVIDGPGPLNFSDAAAVNARGGGAHLISAPMTLSGSFLAGVASGTSLTTTGSFDAAGRDVTKGGAGIWTVKHIRAASLSVWGGTLRIAPDGTPTGASRLESIDVAAVAPAAARLDLTDNALVVASTPLGTWNGSAYTGVSGLIERGRGDAPNAQWDGAGIVTTDTRAVSNNDLTSIGVARAGDALGLAPGTTGTWAGQTVAASDTLVAFTWGGDANLDGKINILDYGQIDFNVGNGTTALGWFGGDFNYDGKINILDYGIIDFNVTAQDGSLAAAAPGATAHVAGSLDRNVASVPEPVTWLFPVVLASLAARRRHRRA